MTDTMAVADVLERAADVLEPEGQWIRSNFAMDALGTPLATGFDPSASCWCILGAIEKVTGGISNATPVSNYLTSFLGVEPSVWNDNGERTQTEVVAALRRAATLARAGDA